MATMPDSNKAKIAKRVIEVLEFFDRSSPQATVMDIVRRYDRPQSSTSELLASLVEMGLLYKDARTRSYSPTPRLGTLGAAAQPPIIREGRIFPFMDRLAASSRHGVALFGMVGTHAQIFRWSPGPEANAPALGCGASESLSATTAGLLLLSTLSAERAGRMLWRINAEAAPGRKFNPTEVGGRIAAYRRAGYATGVAGYVPDAQLTAMLLPRDGAERPLAIGLIYPEGTSIDSDAMLATLRQGIAQCAAREEDRPSAPSAFPLVRAV